MVRAQQKQKQILSGTEVDTLESEKTELEAQLKGEGYGQGTGRDVDRGAIQRQIARIDQALEDGAAPKVSGASKDKLVKELEDLEARLAEGIPTRDEMDHPAKNPGAVRKHINWLARNQANIDRYRTLQRIINPEDPRSYDRLRREK